MIVGDPLHSSDFRVERAIWERFAVLSRVFGAGHRLVPPRGDRSRRRVPVRGVGGVSGGAGHEDVGLRPVLRPLTTYLQVTMYELRTAAI